MNNELAVPAPEQHAIVPERSAGSFTMQDLILMSKAFADSGMFGIKNQAQALTLLLLAQADGIHPAKAMMEYHVINGKPSLSADAMLARHQRGGGKVQWITRTDEKVTAIFTGPLGEVEITWDQARATKAQLWGKENFRKHPAQMLAARCVSEGVRATNPAAVQGIYTPEEVVEFAPAEQPAASYELDRAALPAGEADAPPTILVRCQVKSVVERTSRGGDPYRDVTLTSELGGTDHYVYLGHKIATGFTGPIDANLGETAKGKPVINHIELVTVEQPAADEGGLGPPLLAALGVQQ